MPITMPTADPMTFGYTPLSNGRILIVANSAVSWSLVQARRYADGYGIPRANILELNLGTDLEQWVPVSNAALFSTYIDPVRTAVNSVLAQAVLTAPGMPRGVFVQNITAGSTYTAGVGAVCSLTYLGGAVRHLATAIDTYSTANIACYQVSGGFAPCVMRTISPVVIEPRPELFPPEYRVGLTNTYSSIPDSTWATLYTGPNGETEWLYLPSAQAALGAATNRHILQGRIGYGWGPGAYGSPPADTYETEATVGAIVQAGLEAAHGNSTGNRYRHQIHLCLSIVRTCKSLAYLVQQLQGWGYRVSYSYREGASDADTEPYAPLAGQLYSQADLEAGRVRDVPYHIMFGEGANPGTGLGAFSAPEGGAWQPSGGGGSAMGPSFGWGYAMQGLTRGGTSGFANNDHVTTALYAALYHQAYHLLAGWTWAETAYFDRALGSLYYCPVGDPLARPFPV